jgi:DNA-binding GntR family transcriptional regulator
METAESTIKEKKRGRRWNSFLPTYSFSALHKISNKPILEQTYEVIRHAILSGDLPPGSWLRIDIISSQLSVSQTPVREALNLLRKEGLVDVIPNYGFHVSSLQYEKFEEIYAIRIGIEQLAAKRSMEVLDADSLELLNNTFKKLETYKDKKLEIYLQHEWKFRLLFYSLGSSAQFISQIREYRDQAERYLRLAYFYPTSIEDSFQLHVDLLEACNQQDKQKAVEDIKNALLWTVRTAGPTIKNGLSNIHAKT